MKKKSTGPVAMAVLFSLMVYLLAAWATAEDTASASKAADIGKIAREAIREALPLSSEEIVEIIKEAAKQKQANPVLTEQVIETVIVFLTGLVIVCGFIYYRFRKARLLHETIRIMVEKGAPIPPELLIPPVKKKSDFRSGILLIAVGTGLSIFLRASTLQICWSVGLFLIIIGLGYLLVWGIEQRRRSPQMHENNSQ